MEEQRMNNEMIGEGKQENDAVPSVSLILRGWLGNLTASQLLLLVGLSYNGCLRLVILRSGLGG